MEILFPILGLSLTVMTLIWFILCSRMLNLLKEHHPDIYAEIGSPSIGLKSSISSDISFLKFLIKRDWRSLDDSRLSSLGNFMLKFGAAHILLFLLLIFLIEHCHAI